VVLTVAFAPDEDRTLKQLFRTTMELTSLLATVLAILVVTSEWSQRTALSTFTLVPRRERVIADNLGTPLTLTPLTVNTQMRVRQPVRRYLHDDQRVRATLTITAEDVNGARTIATKDITLRR
jgi:hypothetical protein